MSPAVKKAAKPAKPAAKVTPIKFAAKDRAMVPAKPAAKTPARPVVRMAAPKGAPAPIGKMGGKGRMGGKGGAGAHHRSEPGGHEQVGLEFEMVEPPIPVVVHEPPILPTPSRRKPKPGSPDWPGEGLTVGMEAPAISLPSTLGRKVTLAEFRGMRVVLYFYPKDDTPGCTMEACGFRDNMSRITSKDAVVLGISLDDELSHQRFAQKYNLQFPLLSDVDAAICRRYGAYKEKSLYGRSFWGVERTTFVIDREGKVENVFRRVKVEGHADEVLATLSV
ncbi:MAG: thioredoxin-dependent thiol peroxidase [Candidatus Eisenbacteria bacterium]